MITSDLDRRSPIPLYFQLKTLLLGELNSGGYAAGHRLPGEHELCQEYGISRTVVRQALFELEAAGAVERLKGKGTFVAQPKTTEGLVQSVAGLYEDVLKRGGKLRSEVRTLRVISAQAEVASELRLDVGDPVVFLERLRFVDEVAWVYTYTHVPYRLAPGLEGADMSVQSLYGVLEQDYGIQIHSARRSVEATLADAVLAKNLGVHRGGPLLMLKSTSYDAADQPVETFTAFHRGDRSRFETVVSRQSVSNAQMFIDLTDAGVGSRQTSRSHR